MNFDFLHNMALEALANGYKVAKKQLSRQSMLYRRYDPSVLKKIPVPDTASFLAGVYQGSMNAAGLPIDDVATTTAVLGGSGILNFLSARYKSPRFNGKSANPNWVGAKQAARGTAVNGLEMAVGYAVGQVVYRVLN